MPCFFVVVRYVDTQQTNMVLFISACSSLLATESVPASSSRTFSCFGPVQHPQYKALPGAMSLIKFLSSLEQLIVTTTVGH